MNEFSIFNTPDVDCVEAAKEILPEYFHRPIPHLPAPDGTMDPTAVIGVFVEKKSECQFLTVLDRPFGFKTTKALADISGKATHIIVDSDKNPAFALGSFYEKQVLSKTWLVDSLAKKAILGPEPYQFKSTTTMKLDAELKLAKALKELDKLKRSKPVAGAKKRKLDIAHQPKITSMLPEASKRPASKLAQMTKEKPVASTEKQLPQQTGH